MAPLLAGIALAGLTAWQGAPAAADPRPEDPRPTRVEQRGTPFEAPGAPRKPLNTVRDVYTAIEACYRPPPLERSRPGMQITFQLSFRRDGNILGEARITYETPQASEDQRYAYRLAVAEALQRCTPLPFSESLGHAVAGRPFNMRIIDNRQRQGI